MLTQTEPPGRENRRTSILLRHGETWNLGRQCVSPSVVPAGSSSFWAEKLLGGVFSDVILNSDKTEEGT